MASGGTPFRVTGVCVALATLAANWSWAAIHTDWMSRRCPVQFERISVDRGLSQGTIKTILQDREGFLWFGTDNGLNRYDGYQFTVYHPMSGADHGLAGHRILDLLEDSQGRLWVAVEGGGVALYDRELDRFTSHRRYRTDLNDPGGEFPNRFLEDRFGHVWIGTDGWGLNRLRWKDGDTSGEPIVDHYSHDPNDPKSLGANTVRGFYEDSRGDLWVGTEGGGLNRVDRSPTGVVTFTRFLPEPDRPSSARPNRVTDIEGDPDDTLWIATEGGLYRFHPEDGRFVAYRHDPSDPLSLGRDLVRTLYRDRAGTLWVGTDGGGLHRMRAHDSRPDPAFQRYAFDPGDDGSLSSNAVEVIYEDRSGVLWVGTYRAGLNKLALRQASYPDRECGQFLHYRATPCGTNALSHNHVNAFYEDSSGNLWIGTDGGGLNHVPPDGSADAEPRFIHYGAIPGDPNRLSDNVVTAIGGDRLDHVWVGTYTGGLNRITPPKQPGARAAIRHYRHDPSDGGSLGANFVGAIHEDSSGTLWIGTIGGGLNRFDRERDAFTRFQADPENYPAGLVDNSVFSLQEGPFGDIWIGTQGGLNRLNPGTGEIRHYLHDPADPQSLSRNPIRSIHRDSRGILWIGTDGGGLNRLSLESPDAPVRFQRYTGADGLPSDVVLGVVEDEDGGIWLGTDRGLSRLDPATGVFTNYTRKDGLQSDEFNRGAYLRARSGALFFGGVNGFNVFDPTRIRPNESVPPVVIVDFQLFNRSVSPESPSKGRRILTKSIWRTREIDLSHQDFVFSFEFAALHYVAPEENRYAYRMEGLEANWNHIGNRRYVTYTTLPPGEYTFRVKAANSDGVWNEEGAAIRVRIRPPLWKTAWFRILVLLTALGGVLLVYWLRVRALEANRRELRQLVAERTAQLGESARRLEGANAELERANFQLRRLAMLDPLTGIPNVRRFYEFLDGEWRRCRRSGQPLSLILIDIDCFKAYNDTYGHQAGDQCLKRVASIIQERARRPTDLAARYGGEEFVLAAAETGLEGAFHLAEEIRSAVEGEAIRAKGSSVSDRVTVSVGVASLVPDSRGDFRVLIRQADEALYRSKQAGRNRCTRADPGTPHRPKDHLRKTGNPWAGPERADLARS